MTDSQLTQGGVAAALLAMIGGVCLAFVKMLQNNGCVFASKCCTFDCNKGRAEKPPGPLETTTETYFLKFRLCSRYLSQRFYDAEPRLKNWTDD